MELERGVLEGRRVGAGPGTAFYVRDFLSAEEEAELLERVDAAPKPKWEQLANRRLQNWGGIIGKKGSLIPDEIPAWLRAPMDKVAELFPQDAQPNHCLVNEYLPGQGIMPHTDGPAFHPLITTLSLGSHTLLDLYRPLGPDEDPDPGLASRWVGCLLLEPRSLVVLTGELYSSFLHGINPLKVDRLEVGPWNASLCASVPGKGMELERSKRVSLTIRSVPKVAKNSIANLIGRR